MAVTSSSDGAFEGVKFILAFVLTLLYIWLVYAMWQLTTTTKEIEWTRAVYLLSGVESIVFAAVGFLFGREVHRERANKAESRAIAAAEKAEAAQHKAEQSDGKGRELKGAVQTLRAATMDRAVNLVPSAVDRVADLAERLFPST
jgi:hypothetical protein